MEFLYSLPEEGEKVGNSLLTKIYQSKYLFSTTGFTSIEYIAFIVRKAVENSNLTSIKILIGNDISPIKGHDLMQSFEICEEYWRNKKFNLNSIINIKCLQDVIEGKLNNSLDFEIRYDRSLKHTQHSKIYITEKIAAQGSSNLSFSGMYQQKEIVGYSEDPSSSEYADIKRINNKFWEYGEDCSEEINRLLKSILSVVTLGQALRNIHDDFLEAKWFVDTDLRSLVQPLWPHQKIIAAETLSIISRMDACLVAAATGSGKTKIASSVGRKVFDEMSGGSPYSSPDIITVICPPNVIPEWKEELKAYGLGNSCVISSGKMGQLNEKDSKKDKDIKDQLRRTKFLIVDEAHNYRNQSNKATQALIEYSNPDKLMLLTATPINKQIDDIHGMVSLIGPYNLDEKSFRSISRVLKSNKMYSYDLSESNSNKFKEALSSFIVRKTKKDINLIAKNHSMKEYPRENVVVYDIDISLNDVYILNQIDSLADRLRGLDGIQQKEVPDSYDNLRRAVNQTRGKAIWNLKYLLRSSVPAAVQYIMGDMGVLDAFPFLDSFIKTDNIDSKEKKLKKIRPYDINGVCYPKEIESAPDSIKLYFDEDMFYKAVEEEICIYGEIFRLIMQLSKDYSKSKIDLLKRLVEKDKKVIAFDDTPISVYYYYYKLKECLPDDVKILQATGGDSARNRIEAKETFGSEARDEDKAILLATKVLSESVNLQSAKSIIHMDLPLTPALAEQRNGRISRMNSKHEFINFYWPNYKNRIIASDYKFSKRIKNIDHSIRGNISIPDYLYGISKISNVSFEDIEIEVPDEDIERETERLEINDYMSYIKNIFYKGDEKIFDFKNISSVYDSDTSIACAVGSVSNWCLVHLSNYRTGQPSLMFVDCDDNYKVYKDYRSISNKFSNLICEVDIHEVNSENIYMLESDFFENVANKIEDIIERDSRVQQLSGKDQSLINLLINVLEYAIEDIRISNEKKIGYQEVLNLINDKKSDKKKIATKWYDMIKDTWARHVKSTHKRKKQLPRFEDLTNDIHQNLYSPEMLIDTLSIDLNFESSENTIKTIIFGFKNKGGSPPL